MSPVHCRRVLVGLSGGALLVAMVVDTLAMVGRQVGIPLLGSIEIVQVAALVAASGALIVATLERVHARVNLLLERLPARWRSRVDRLHWLAAVAFFAALTIGTVWIARDLWGGHEESELLRIPYRPLRIVVTASLIVLMAVAVVRLRARRT